MNVQNPPSKSSQPFDPDATLMSSYQRAYLIGIRLMQLNEGAIPATTYDNNRARMPLTEIARNDVRSGKLNLVLRMYHPDGTPMDARVLPNFYITPLHYNSDAAM